MERLPKTLLLRCGKAQSAHRSRTCSESSARWIVRVRYGVFEGVRALRGQAIALFKWLRLQNCTASRAVGNALTSTRFRPARKPEQSGPAMRDVRARSRINLGCRSDIRHGFVASSVAMANALGARRSLPRA